MKPSCRGRLGSTRTRMRRLAQESTDLLLFYKICTADCRDAGEWAGLTRAAELHQAEETELGN